MKTLLFGFGEHSKKLKSRVVKLIASAAILCSIAAIAPARAPKISSQEPKYEMGTFYICLLVKPPNFSARQASQQLFQSHLNHVKGLLASGKAVIAGPF